MIGQKAKTPDACLKLRASSSWLPAPEGEEKLKKFINRRLITKLIADFDETISEKDTINLIVHAAAESRQAEKSKFLDAWKEMVDWYATRYLRLCNNRLSVRCEQETDTEARQGGLTDFLRSFERLEQASIQRVIESRFLAGLTKEKLREVGRGVAKKRGVEQALSAARESGIGVEVLSANWSTALIEAATEGFCDRITANCLVYDETGRSTGHIDLRIVSARDKLRLFQQRRDKTGNTLYIGDSISDLLAILDADVGVLIGRNRIAMRTIERFALPTQRLTKEMQFDPNRRYQGTILRVESWETLASFISAGEGA